jgi:CDP-glucose 4,6-dehydratase
VGPEARAVESVVTRPRPDPAFWNGKRVFVTGHTGFKGSWLCVWLKSLGAQVHGFALSPPTLPNMFEQAAVESTLASNTIADIRNRDQLAASMARAQPEIVMHLAAQPLVRHSYHHPVETYEVNVMGVVHVLEAVRATGGVRVVVNVTTDKCYENHERPSAYQESEAMGGRDPYSSSKGCAELVTAAYRDSFLASAGVAVSTARAGNVIGGGDWAADRLVPDLFRALDTGTPLRVRAPGAIRPWQHVLEPLSGYLLLAEHLYLGGSEFAEAWNFGPAEEDEQTVGWIVEQLASRLPELAWERDPAPHPHEAHYLKLDSSKARSRLGWHPRWRLGTALHKTSDWHRAWKSGGDMREMTMMQIHEYAAAQS